jgi:hypothetical protein
MKPYRLLLLSIITLLSSCTHRNDPTLGFTIGIPEKQWNGKINEFIKDTILKKGIYRDDSIIYKYQWNTSQGIIPAYITFNHSGNEDYLQGNLRSILILFNSDTTPGFRNGDFVMEKFYNPGHGIIKLSEIDKILKELTFNYGQPDSIILDQYSKNKPSLKKYDVTSPYDPNVGDTTRGYYLWRKQNERIEFEYKGIIKQKTYHYRYANYAYLQIRAKDYKEEIHKIIEDVRKELRPNDLIKLKLAPPILLSQDKNLSYRIIQLRFYRLDRLRIEEPRGIKSIKFDALFSNQFGDTILSYQGIISSWDYDLKANQELRSQTNPWPFMIDYDNPVSIGTLRYSSYGPTPLSVIKLNNYTGNLKCEAKISAVVFDDGTVLKDSTINKNQKSITLKN